MGPKLAYLKSAASRYPCNQSCKTSLRCLIRHCSCPEQELRVHGSLSSRMQNRLFAAFFTASWAMQFLTFKIVQLWHGLPTLTSNHSSHLHGLVCKVRIKAACSRTHYLQVQPRIWFRFRTNLISNKPSDFFSSRHARLADYDFYLLLKILAQNSCRRPFPFL